jgi:hypothetical protein
MRLVLMVSLVFSLLAPPASFAQQLSPGGLASITGAPFSGVRSQQNAKSFVDGNRIDNGGSVRLYRDSQGRTRVEPLNLPHIQITDPVSGNRYELDTQTKTYTVIKGGAPTAQPLTDHVPGIFVMFGRRLRGVEDPGWSQPVALGDKNVEGLRIIGASRKYTIPVGEMGNEKPIVLTVEQWYAPELGLIVSKHARATLGGEFSTDIENIKKGEPDPALFQIPSDYTPLVARR